MASDVIERKDPVLNVIRAFAGLRRELESSITGQRVLMSVCTGSLILGNLGLLSGLKATTHSDYLDLFQKICTISAEGSGRESTRVLKARFVDAGPNQTGTRINTAGGNSRGLDASLYLVMLKVGRKVADEVAGVAEHKWREVEGVVVS